MLVVRSVQRYSGRLAPTTRVLVVLRSGTEGQGGLLFAGGGESSGGQNSPELKSGRDSGEARA